jgi:hypothetical protein
MGKNPTASPKVALARAIAMFPICGALRCCNMTPVALASTGGEFKTLSKLASEYHSN